MTIQAKNRSPEVDRYNYQIGKTDHLDPDESGINQMIVKRKEMLDRYKAMKEKQQQEKERQLQEKQLEKDLEDQIEKKIGKVLEDLFKDFK